MQREAAALIALQVAGPEETPTILADLIAARTDKQVAVNALAARGGDGEEELDEFICAWHRDPGKDKDGKFRGRGRVIFEVTGAWLYREDGETPEFEWKNRFEPRYFVGCLGCNETFGLLEHLME